jgi:hypothetical protein
MSIAMQDKGITLCVVMKSSDTFFVGEVAYLYSGSDKPELEA